MALPLSSHSLSYCLFGSRESLCSCSVWGLTRGQFRLTLGGGKGKKREESHRSNRRVRANPGWRLAWEPPTRADVAQTSKH
ncbi:hypothetical protein CFAM422_009778 [Trichoderma lentiforme]|uniref:Uncharacterized protein n=1 Tax=Trichoderma lentiforme TaxID=1567552 RepID=A0A9P4X901_9HYPO|nr:hypothetical protein CFAM422_009778 [Trichoderma lentiforme]